MICCFYVRAASGMRPPDKRDGAGARNWGTVADDMEYVDLQCLLINVSVINVGYLWLCTDLL